MMTDCCNDFNVSIDMQYCCALRCAIISSSTLQNKALAELGEKIDFCLSHLFQATDAVALSKDQTMNLSGALQLVTP
ncbi:hypothetical protein RRG08_039672 [Elysia crispata]|uniref:Uncharacterized protein n=1 Tax=Elysia crispata TaxID=231223 RepID=A0AAE0YBK7_9GAST|nr:hypothetical protein RRG08_039672 [Elysia crispata]